MRFVGLHHSVCFGSELFSEGWVGEKFADIIFYCNKPRTNNNNKITKILQANRSNIFIMLCQSLNKSYIILFIQTFI